VPPFATVTVPVTFAALPVMLPGIAAAAVTHNLLGSARFEELHFHSSGAVVHQELGLRRLRRGDLHR